MKNLWRAVFPLLGLTLGVIACGARSEVLGPGVTAAGGGGAGGSNVEERTCLPDCTIGHRCCVGSCGGPAVITETDCCSCLDGEVDSGDCPDFTCGGGQCKDLGAACAGDDECCSGLCDYPGAGAEKMNCLAP